MITMHFPKEAWEDALRLAEEELYEYGHYMNNQEDNERITKAAVEVALERLGIEVETDE